MDAQLALTDNNVTTDELASVLNGMLPENNTIDGLRMDPIIVTGRSS